MTAIKSQSEWKPYKWAVGDRALPRRRWVCCLQCVRSNYRKDVRASLTSRLTTKIIVSDIPSCYHLWEGNKSATNQFWIAPIAVNWRQPIIKAHLILSTKPKACTWIIFASTTLRVYPQAKFLLALPTRDIWMFVSFQLIIVYWIRKERFYIVSN